MFVIEHLELVLRHIEHVRNDCEVLGKKLIEAGELAIGLQLIANGHIHDNSKLSGIELEYLNEETKIEYPDKFELAWQQHVKTNPHHPEYWGNIDEMPRIYLAEWVCDCHTRSSEFGTDLREWVKNDATRRFKITTSGRTYKQIKEFIDLLLERKFTNGTISSKAYKNGTVRNAGEVEGTKDVHKKVVS
jgi:hypothetical protein